MPDPGWSLGLATPKDAGDIARLVRASLAAPVRRYTIWASPRASRYVHALLCGAFPSEAHQFYLLRRGLTPAGLAAFRLLGQAAFLNHLYIAPRFRGRSLGSLLLASAARRYLAQHPAPEIALEVFAGNRRAGAWYERLGFEPHAKLGWWVSTGAMRVPRFPLAASGGDDEARRHRAWGFSQFPIETPGGRYQVGRLCTSWFRLTDPRAAADADLQAALAALDPRRRLLLIAPRSAASPRLAANWRTVARSRRLHSSPGVVLDRLAAGRPAGVALLGTGVNTRYDD